MKFFQPIIALGRRRYALAEAAAQAFERCTYLSATIDAAGECLQQRVFDQLRFRRKLWQTIPAAVAR
jgi:hypothetical protein